MLLFFSIGLLACLGSRPHSSTSQDPDTASDADTFREPDSDSSVDDSDTAAESDTARDTATAIDTDGDGHINLESEADAKLIGEGTDPGSWWASLSLTASGDLDSDGTADIVMGFDDYTPSGKHGRTYVVRGPVRGDLPLDAADVILSGSEYEAAGSAISSGSDIDGDGVHDLIVGAPKAELSGRVYVLRGPLTRATALSDAVAILEGEYFPHEYGLYLGDAGHSVASDGDATGDGVADVLVGAPFAEYQNGAVYIVPGPLSGVIQLSESVKVLGEGGRMLGQKVSYAGDTNGDGVVDILLGQRNGSPVALLFLGPVGGDLVAGDVDSFIGAPSGGYHSIGAGDLDADGYDDVVVDYIYDNEGGASAGAAYVFLGPVSSGHILEADAKFVGSGAADQAGTGLCAGDIDGDGFGDIAVGARAGDTYPGAVYLAFGPPSGTVSLADSAVTLHGGDDDRAGSPVACGDLDSDGRTDILVGGPTDAEGGEDAGAGWVVYAASLVP